MGAWSEDNFGNDDAGDWIYDLEKSRGVTFLVATVQRINDTNDYLEAPDCSEALAAAEVIAAALSGDRSTIPPEASQWLDKKQGLLFGKKPQVEAEHALVATRAVEKIIKASELQELWQETDSFDAWLAVQQSLLAHLSRRV